MQQQLCDDMKEDLFFKQIEKSKQFKPVLALFQQNIAYGMPGLSRTYDSEMKSRQDPPRRASKKKLSEGYESRNEDGLKTPSQWQSGGQIQKAQAILAQASS